MAWRSSGRCNTSLVDNLWKNGLITQDAVKRAFLAVDRGNYAPHMPYEDSPQAIGNKATISAPHMHANAAETLLPYLLPPTTSSTSSSSIGAAGRPRRILDIGSGSGYLTHIFAELAGADAVVVGVEHISALRDLGEANMGKSAGGRELLASGRVRFQLGDGRQGWVDSEMPGAATNVGGVADEDDAQGWDAIHVGAAAAEMHSELVRQLRRPGRMFIPVEDERTHWDQHIWVVDKDEHGKVEKKRLYGVRYVPLTDPPLD
ncbi:protein-L-isoaspartate O-methyltransferase-domain-containing protein [Nemania sp. FL0916]|nr:protein-L-isoaspartate O-methyltransferase-domain-containing protein [Nemania sp. FL0916]